MLLVAAVETNDQGHPLRAVFASVKSFCRAEIAAWARSWLTSGLGWISLFPGTNGGWLRHDPQIVGTQRKSTDMACFAWVNTLLSNLKTAITGTYHGFKFENTRPLFSRCTVPTQSPF